MYILTLLTHTNCMENMTKQSKKKTNPMKKIGKGIKDTFIEMSSSLAGWIDDTGNQFSSKKSSAKKNQKTAPQNKTTSTQTKSSCNK